MPSMNHVLLSDTNIKQEKFRRSRALRQLPANYHRTRTSLKLALLLASLQVQSQDLEDSLGLEGRLSRVVFGLSFSNCFQF